MRWRITGVNTAVLLVMMAFTAPTAADPTARELQKCEMAVDGDAKVVDFTTYTRQGSTAPLYGLMVQPDRGGPYPAVVLLHRVFGIETPDCFKNEMRRYRSWGYLSLLVDSNSAPREVRTGTSGETLTGYSHADQAADALGAVDYIGSLPDVEASEVAIVGHAYGGRAAMLAISGSSTEGMQDSASGRTERRILAAVAWHPACPVQLGPLGTPLLIVMGAKDSVNSSRACRSMSVTTLEGVSTPQHAIFPEAGHNFDMDWFTEYDPETTERAYERIRKFLAQQRSP